MKNKTINTIREKAKILKEVMRKNKNNTKLHASIALWVSVFFIMIVIIIKPYRGYIVIGGFLLFCSYMTITVWRIYHPKLDFSINFVDCPLNEYFYYKLHTKIIRLYKIAGNKATSPESNENYNISPNAIIALEPK